MSEDKPKKGRGRPRKNPVSEEKASSVDNSLGPNTFLRDDHGLLKNIQYTFAEDGSIDWRAMVKAEHLFPNRTWFEGRGEDIPNSVEGLKDHQLIIKLGGIKELARLRGFTSVSYYTEKCEADHVAVNCTIDFIPNYETAGATVSFQDMANATLNNTHDFGQNYLETMACNRAFCRCVRNFLNIHIVSSDEVGKVTPIKAKSGSPSVKDALSPQAMIKTHFNDDFEAFIALLRRFWQQGTYKHEAVSSWNSFNDVPTKEARVLLKMVKETS